MDNWWILGKLEGTCFCVCFCSGYVYFLPYPVCCYKWMIFHIIHTLFLNIVGKVLVYVQGWKDLGPLLWHFCESLVKMVTSSKSAASWKGHMYPYVTCRKHILYGKFTLQMGDMGYSYKKWWWKPFGDGHCRGFSRLFPNVRIFHWHVKLPKGVSHHSWILILWRIPMFMDCNPHFVHWFFQVLLGNSIHQYSSLWTTISH